MIIIRYYGGGGVGHWVLKMEKRESGNKKTWSINTKSHASTREDH